jgi:hypothetical protein
MCRERDELRDTQGGRNCYSAERNQGDLSPAMDFPHGFQES